MLDTQMPQPDISHQMHEDLRWCRRNHALQQHAGRLIVVHKKQVLAVGDDRALLLTTAASADHPREELVVVEILRDDFDIPPDDVY